MSNRPAIPRAGQASLLAKILRNPLGAFGVGFIGLVVLAAVLAPVITTHDPHFAQLTSILANPGEHGMLLGGDGAGRDVFARLVFGARNTLAGAALALSVSALIGTISGLVAGYFGKWFDSVSNAGASMLQALPGIVVLIAARAVVGPSLWWAMAIFGVLLSVGFFRIVRQTVRSVREELYIDAARVAGLSDSRIILRHVLRVVRAPMIIQAGFIASIAVAIQAGLEIIGMGDDSLITWGGMLNDAFARMFQQPILLAWPALAIALVCLSFTFVGNSLRDALEGGGKVRRSKALTEAPRPGAAAGRVAMGEDELLRVEDLRLGYTNPDGSLKEIVHGIDFHVNRGEVVGLIGESGSGKTQTAFAVMRLMSEGGGISGGRVLWRGQDLAALSEKELAEIRGPGIAYIPQEPMSNLDPSFTIGSQLIERMRRHLPLTKQQAYERAVELLKRVQIRTPERVLKSYPHQVSGGMAQRVLIAAAISCEPDLLIADEPTTALDVTVQAEILELLRDLQKEFRFGILLVTHNFGVVADICDRVLVMQDGSIVERGAVTEIFAHREHPYTRQLFGAILSPDKVRAPYEPPTEDSAPAPLVKETVR